MTNLYREHPDWHGSEEAYRAEKLRLLALPGVRVARAQRARRAAASRGACHRRERCCFGVAPAAGTRGPDGITQRRASPSLAAGAAAAARASTTR